MGDVEYCAQISDMTNYEQLRIPQNILSYMTAKAFLQDYDHAKYKLLLEKLLRIGSEGLKKQNKRMQMIFNSNLDTTLKDYIMFGCSDKPEAKEFAEYCALALVDQK